MFNLNWKRIIKREVIVLTVCMMIGLTLAIIGRIIGRESNCGQLFVFAFCVFSGLLYFSVQSIRAIGWSILNLMKN